MSGAPDDGCQPPKCQTSFCPQTNHPFAGCDRITVADPPLGCRISAMQWCHRPDENLTVIFWQGGDVGFIGRTLGGVSPRDKRDFNGQGRVPVRSGIC